MAMPPMPWRLLVIVVLLGGLSGAVFGFVRGLSYVRTLPFAVIEGGILFGVPALLLGLLLVGLWSLAGNIRRHLL